MKSRLLFLVAMLLGLVTTAQISYNATFQSNVNGTLGGVNTETSITTTTGWTIVPGSAGPLSANIWSNAVALPFAFDFYGTPVTGVCVSAHGLATFTTSVAGTTPAAGNNTTLPSALLPDNTIAAFWTEFTSAAPTGSGDNVYYRTWGTAPNRQFWLRWYSYEMGNPSMAFVYNSIVLEEGTNKIYIIDHYSGAGYTDQTTVGVQKDITTAITANSSYVFPGNGTVLTDDEVYTLTPFTPSPIDAGASALVSPAPGCFGANEAVSITVVNYGTSALDLAANPVTVTVNVTGATTQTLNETFNTGSIPVGGSINLTMSSTLNMTAVGTYTFNATATAVGDPNAANGSMSPATRTVTTTYTLPQFADFTGSTVAPTGWTTTNWIIGGSAAAPHGNPFNGLYKNVFLASHTGQFFMLPKVGPVGATDVMTFDFRAVNYTSYGTASETPFDFAANPGTSISVEISTNCGISYTPVYTIGTANNHVTSLNWVNYSVNLSAYAGQTIMIRFNPTWGTGDMFMDFDNFFLGTPPTCPAPTLVNATNVLDVSAQIGWTTGGGTLDSVRVEYGPAGFTPGTGTSVLAISNPFSLTGLTPNTAYSAYVTEYCAAGAGTTRSFAPASFNTLCSPQPFPGNTVAAAFVVGSFPYSSTLLASEWSCYTSTNANRASRDVFYQFTVDSCATQATVSLCNSSVAWDTYLTILAADGTTTIVTADDVCGTHASATFNVQPGATYYAMVEPYSTTTAPTNPITVDITQTLGVANPAFTLATVQPTCATATNGSVSVNLTNINKSPIGYTWSTGATTASLSGVGVGMYYVTVTNGCGGSKVDSVQLSSSFTVALTSQTNISCVGGNNGAINITVAGGVAPYAFAWSNGATTEDLAGLVAGAYTGTVTDAALCQLSATVTITQPAPITIAINDIDNVSCNGGANGAIDLTVNGGTNLPPVPGQLTTIFTGGNGCTNGNMFDLAVNTDLEITGFDISFGTTTGIVDIYYKTGSYIGSQTTPAAWTLIYSGTLTGVGLNLPTPVALASPLALTAGNYAFYVNGDLDYTTIPLGTTYVGPDMTLTVGNGVCTPFTAGNAGRAWNGTIKYQTPGAGFSYLWSNGATTEDASGLVAGTYTMTVTDGNGCVYYTPSIPVTQPTALALGAASTTNVSCAGGNNGAQNITVTGGTMPYTYAWSNGATTRNLTGLTAGTYNGVATDANGCTIAYGPYTVTAPAPLAVAVDAATGATCNGGTNASLTITVSGGTAPYAFNWSNGATTEDLLAVAAGAYTGTITDTRGCTLVAGPVTLTQPTAIAATVDTTANVLCAGGTDGLISISVAGGTAPYTYNWSNGSTNEDLTGLAAGAYTGTITDAAGCTLVAGPVTITEPAALAVAGATVTNVSCFGGANGAIDATISGGTTPYSFSWSNGSTDEDLTGLSAGQYTGTVTDANGCTLVAGPVDITEPADAVAVMVDTIVQIAGCAGDSTGEISITVSGGTAPYTFSWSNGSTDEDLTALAAGDYTGTITDANGCVLVAGPVTITEPTAVAVTAAVVTDVACFGDASGGINITVAGGTAPYAFNWSNGTTTEDLNAVIAGDYTGSITDANGCLLVAGPVTVGQPAAALAIGGVTLTPISCNGANDGGVDVTIVGGTTPYTYAWSNGSTDASISGLGAGIYSGTVTDANGCTLVGGPAPISEPTALTATATATQPSAAGVNDGAITTTVTGGTAPFTYSWSNGATTAGLTGLGAGAYGVAIVDANGCLTTAAANILDLTSIVDAEGVNVFEIFPNPANEVVNIRMELAEAQDVNLELYSVDGKLVDAQAFGRTLTMNYRLDVSRLANGVYMAKVLVGTQVIVQRVVVTK